MRAFACPVCNNFTAFEVGSAVATCHADARSSPADEARCCRSLDGAATVDGQRWVRCTQSRDVGLQLAGPRGAGGRAARPVPGRFDDPPRTRRGRHDRHGRSWCRPRGRCGGWCTSSSTRPARRPVLAPRRRPGLRPAVELQQRRAGDHRARRRCHHHRPRRIARRLPRVTAGSAR